MKSQFLLKQGRRLIGLSLGIAILIIISLLIMEKSQVLAKEYPLRPINIIVSWPPGTSTDLVPRIMAPKFSIRWGVPVNITNKPGGSGLVGAYEAVNAAPDGYTVLVEAPGISSVPYAWVERLPFDVENRIYIARAAFTPLAIIVRGDAPWKTMEDIEKEIRNNPASFRWSLSGGSAATDVPTAQFKNALAAKGVDLSKTKTVNFQGTAQIMTALGGGHVDIAIGGQASGGAMLTTGRARVIAVCSDQRIKYWPDVPTTAEQGFPSVNFTYWVGYSAPPGFPQKLREIWIEAVKAVMADSEILEKLDKLGVVPAFLGGDDFKNFVINEGKSIKALKLR
jgi:tripartite-type tricarboxylate transporter receptor subunit TctC